MIVWLCGQYSRFSDGKNTSSEELLTIFAHGWLLVVPGGVRGGGAILLIQFKKSLAQKTVRSWRHVILHCVSYCVSMKIRLFELNFNLFRIRFLPSPASIRNIPGVQCNKCLSPHFGKYWDKRVLHKYDARILATTRRNQNGVWLESSCHSAEWFHSLLSLLFWILLSWKRHRLASSKWASLLVVFYAEDEPLASRYRWTKQRSPTKTASDDQSCRVRLVRDAHTTVAVVL